METLVERLNGPIINASPLIQEIDIVRLVKSDWNPRQLYPETTTRELEESMRQHGFRSWQPIVGRPIRNGQAVEIAAGHRRFVSACRAGVQKVPCIVRDLTDDEFLDILNFDNSGREDVHPLHESAGWSQWMEKTGGGVTDIAARIGQSKEYVYVRLKYSSLIEEARKAFLDGEITAGHAIHIARLQPRDQKNALKFLEPPAWDRELKVSVRKLAEFIRRDVHLDMASAAFSLDSEDLLPAAGSCASCPKRTKNAAELQALDGDANDACTDPACFNTKLDRHLVQIKSKLIEKCGEVLSLSSQYGGAKKGLVSPRDYTVVPEATAGAKAAVIEDGPKTGQVVFVKVTPKEPAADKQGSGDLSNDREDELRAKVKAREVAVRQAILQAVRLKISGVSRFELEKLILLVDYDVAEVLCQFHGIQVDNDPNEALEKALPKLTADQVTQMAIEAPFAHDFEHYSVERALEPKDLLNAAKRYKVDAVKIRRQIEDQMKEAEGGKRKEVKKPIKVAPAKKKAAAVKKAPAATKSPAPAKKAATKKAVTKTKGMKKP